MFFPRSGTWGTMYRPLLYHFFLENGTRLCDGKGEVQYTPSRAPRMGRDTHCETCQQYARERRRVYGRVNAGIAYGDHWPPLLGPAF